MYANDFKWLSEKFEYYIAYIDLLPPQNLRIPIIGFHVINTS
jgi:hypothetical protein